MTAVRDIRQFFIDELKDEAFTIDKTGAKTIELIGTSFIADEPAITELQNLLKYEGLYLGGSSAINLLGAVELAKQMGKGHTICTILCDSGQRYESKIWNKEFLKKNKLPIPEWLI